MIKLWSYSNNLLFKAAFSSILPKFQQLPAQNRKALIAQATHSYISQETVPQPSAPLIFLLFHKCIRTAATWYDTGLPRKPSSDDNLSIDSADSAVHSELEMDTAWIVINVYLGILRFGVKVCFASVQWPDGMATTSD